MADTQLKPRTAPGAGSIEMAYDVEGFPLCHLDHARGSLSFVETLPLPRTGAPIKEGFEVAHT